MYFFLCVTSSALFTQLSYINTTKKNRERSEAVVKKKRYLSSPLAAVKHMELIITPQQFVTKRNVSLKLIKKNIH